MDLSVVIVSWNTSALLNQCLESLQASSDGLAMEVMVVDNASSDGSPEMVRDRHPRVTLIASESNLGFARANNLALRSSRGRYALLLNPDTIVHPGAVQDMVRWMDGHPECGACGPLLLNRDGSLQASWARMPTVFSELIGRHDRRVDGRDLSQLTVEELSSRDPFEVDWVGGACLMVRREVVDQVGLLDEGYFMYSEETDWCLRIGRAGHCIAVVPSARVVHLGGESSRAVKLRTLFRSEYSRVRFLCRTGRCNRILCLPIAAAFAARAVVRLLVQPVLGLRRRPREQGS